MAEKVNINTPQKENDLISDEANNSNKNSSLFKIDIMELEGLTGKHKERGADFQDIKYFENKPVSELISKLKTDTEKASQI